MNLIIFGIRTAECESEMSEPASSPPVIEFRSVSKWYGQVIGLNNLSLRLPAGVTGLLGPNGSGKSTLLQLATGQLRPSQGEVRVLGHRPWNHPGLNRYIGLCPEQDAFFEWMTGREFLTRLRAAGRPGPARGARGGRAGARPGADDRARRPADPRLFEGDAAADQAGPGDGARPAWCSSSTSR